MSNEKLVKPTPGLPPTPPQGRGGGKGWSPTPAGRACQIEGSALCAEISQIYPKSFILSIRTFDLYRFVGFLVRRTTEFLF